MSPNTITDDTTTPKAATSTASAAASRCMPSSRNSPATRPPAAETIARVAGRHAWEIAVASIDTLPHA